jgi:hypothetical protein
MHSTQDMNMQRLAASSDLPCWDWAKKSFKFILAINILKFILAINILKFILALIFLKI